MSDLVVDGRRHGIVSLAPAASDRLPYTIRIMLEDVLRRLHAEHSRRS